MEYKTNFFKKVMTSIYDIKIFSKYAKEGIYRSISYAMLLTLILVGVKDISIGYKTENIDIISFVYIKIIISILSVLHRIKISFTPIKIKVSNIAYEIDLKIPSLAYLENIFMSYIEVITFLKKLVLCSIFPSRLVFFSFIK